MSRPLLEVIALDADDARAAQAGGADRLELVTDMAADGLTPSPGTFAAVRAAVDLPVRVMLRAADGFSAGGPEGVAVLRAQAEALRAEGAEEFVLGFLEESGQPDVEAVAALDAATGGGRWTFHRAIDRAADRDGLRKRLAELPGPDAFLTAGSAAGVDDGWDVLVAEAARTAAGEPGYEPLLMVGGGLRLDHVPGLKDAGVTAFHIGGAARPEGWHGPVTAGAVARWRTLLDG
ncbi:copper homeostasis protein CutC [Streptomyces sp. DSM 42041]|uniref:Copper homeostasis protein cutC homolog n=1 Tax=Streptomyces hazeniae TaxID=3075538 RepID=A0ABU2NND0_9ACTN|nr:copper homeostasis protein CutC [Streptomyces sp. DSM 42041]MDT0378485.1 copper homeostasis protein CutC [Streptomyces sp. DSM 42041]